VISLTFYRERSIDPNPAAVDLFGGRSGSRYAMKERTAPMRALDAMFRPLGSALLYSALLSALAAQPAPAQGAGPTEVTLSWLQSSDSEPVDTYLVYKSDTPWDQGTLAYVGLPTPDLQGVYSTTVQLEEIDQGIPTYVWVIAANAIGESPASNTNLYPEGCNPQLDSDCDGVDNDGAPGVVPCATGQSLNCDDNCPHWPNPEQEDHGGIGASAFVPDGIGDACQCGDVSGDGRVTTADAVILHRSLLIPPGATMLKPDLCDVGSSVGCNTADAVILKRALGTPPSALIAQQCDPALMP
jgi:hypothetical protein